MATPGYSGTPLLQKLGIKPGHQMLLLHAPDSYEAWLQTPLAPLLAKKKDDAHLVHLFAANKKVFEAAMKKLEPLYRKNTSLIIWVSWYKKSAGIATDITEDIIRAYALQHGLVDIKVCAVSEQWSGLKLVVPVAKR